MPNRIILLDFRAEEMITWNKPPLDLWQTVRTILDRRSKFSVEQLEEAYAEGLGVAHAILLPSARAGIDWALQAALASRAVVLCSAFTCKVVHEAVVRSGKEMVLLDVAPGEFLLDPAAIANASSDHHGLVLCEMYGHTYDLRRLEATVRPQPAIRILDMAMTVPTRRLLERISGNDFGVVSFGIGKSMYAEWGGMGFTRDGFLAAEVRRLRDSCRVTGGPLLGAERTLRILLRTAVSTPEFFIFSRKMRASLSSQQTPSKGALAAWRQSGLPAAWRFPSTELDRKLIGRHLQQSEWYAARRLALAARYAQNLQNVAGIIQPPFSQDPLSHYTIRVSAVARSAIRSRLRHGGIAAGTLFEFPTYLSRRDYPHASLVASEVMNLPLSVNLSPADVDRVCERLIESVS